MYSRTCLQGTPQAIVSLHDRCPLVRERERSAIAQNHPPTESKSFSPPHHKYKKQLQLNHIFIAASLSEKKSPIVICLAAPACLTAQSSTKPWGLVEMSIHANVSRTSGKCKYVPHLGNSLLRTHDDHLLRWLLLCWLLLLALRIFGVHTVGTGDQRSLPLVTCDVSSAGGVIHGNIRRPWHASQQPGVGSTIWLRDFDGVRSDFLSRVSPSSRERRWRGLEARVIHLTDLGRAVSRDLDVKYMAVVTENVVFVHVVRYDRC